MTTPTDPPGEAEARRAVSETTDRDWTVSVRCEADGTVVLTMGDREMRMSAGQAGRLSHLLLFASSGWTTDSGEMKL